MSQIRFDLDNGAFIKLKVLSPAISVAGTEHWGMILQEVRDAGKQEATVNAILLTPAGAVELVDALQAMLRFRGGLTGVKT